MFRIVIILHRKIIRILNSYNEGIISSKYQFLIIAYSFTLNSIELILTMT
jgi:hypothetical protein